MSILALLAIALAPGFAIGVYIYLKDKHEKEPISLLVKSFFYGILSTFVTLALSGAINQFVTIELHLCSRLQTYRIKKGKNCLRNHLNQFSPSMLLLFRATTRCSYM